MLRRRERFVVHSYEVDAFGELALASLAGYLQEAAGLHADELGCGMETLRARGLTWVLVRQRIEAESRVALGDILEVSTWPSGVYPLVVTREFSVTRRGEEVARASTAWLVLDLEKRRAVRPGEVLDARLRPRLEAVAAVPGKLPSPGPQAAEHRFEVRYADIDLNGHVTNTSYLTWALESVPEELWRASRPRAVEAHYLAEARLGESIVVKRTGEAEVLHALSRAEGGEELARLRTRWVARG
ncbi:MAG TPA: acyl-ACP thioesterase domain-containing protein [Anaeromyxobacteraceae bacterium]|nr:acyl-ACP thioesterase domain-containing protein [Anaeromyxobacteraceae bacterium]